MNEKELRFLQDHFRAHYRKSVPVPTDVTSREFGFGWQKKIDFRHAAFSTQREFQEFVIRDVPLFISYSTAYYQLPANKPVSEKGYLGADLVFDLDKPAASTDDHDHAAFFCRICLDQLYKEAVELRKMLQTDFGFDKPLLVFSGQKGFHLHVRSDTVRNLGKEARRQIAEYVSAEGLNTAELFPQKSEVLDSRFSTKTVQQGPSVLSLGWAARVFCATKKAIGEKDEKTMRSFGMTRKNIAQVKDNQLEVIAHLEAGRWGAFCEKPNFEKILQKVRFAQTDKAVTFDLARLIRLPESLHGSTGFRAKVIPDGSDFKVEDALAFDSQQTVEVIPREDVEFELGKKYRLYKARFEGVPLPVAVFLLAQEKAFLP